MRLVRKALACITRTSGDRTEVLVFRQPDFPEAGWQIPGGTVEPGEDPAVAVLREAEEETGLTGLRLVGHLLTTESVWPDSRLERYFYHLEPATPPAETWSWWEEHADDGSPPIAFEFAWRALDGTDLGLAGERGAALPGLYKALSSGS